MSEESKKAQQLFMTACAPVLERIAREHGIETARQMMKTAAIKAGLNPDEFDLFKVGAS